MMNRSIVQMIIYVIISFIVFRSYLMTLMLIPFFFLFWFLYHGKHVMDIDKED